MDDSDIGVLATLDSVNVKTGPSVQTWILRKDKPPHVAQSTGEDKAVCGNCSHRPSLGGDCYVVTYQGPNAVWRQWTSNKLQVATVSQIRGIAKRHGLLRLGAYGDPALMPFSLVQELCEGLRITGYTHQWHMERVKPYAKYCMASCDSEEECKYAKACGFRTFRVVSQGQAAKVTGEVVCPASAEGGNKLQCVNCCACDGTMTGKKSGIVIKTH